MANEGSYRFSGQWGSAYDQAGHLLVEMVEVSAPLEIGRIAVPLVGSQDEGHKQGRNTREGTLSVQKIDSAWELLVYSYSSKTVEERRALRDAGTPFDPSFNIVIKYDDPEALGFERWQIEGVRLWRLTLGFNISDELVQREYPITWETERPLDAFKKTRGKPTAEYAFGGGG
jgi:hypothetical protein